MTTSTTTPPAPRTVWLASYPKSGNTWVRALMAAVDHGHVSLDSTLRGAVISGARGPLEWMTGLVSSELRDEEANRLRPLVDAHLDRNLPADRPGFWHRKIHDALLTTPGGPPIVSSEATHAAIYVVRDPRDVAVSYGHHMGVELGTIVNSMGSPGTRLAWNRDRVNNQFGQFVGTWSFHVESWLDHSPFPVLLVRYEDLLAEPAVQLGRIARTLGREVSPEQLDAAVAEASFESLKAKESESGFREAMHPDRRFFRRGVAGAWREELAPELAARIEADHQRVMTRLGYLATTVEDDEHGHTEEPEHE